MKKIVFESIINEFLYANILTYNNSYKHLTGSKPLRIRLDKMDGFRIVCDGTRYLIFFGSEKYEAIYDRIRYLISLKIGISYIFSHYSAKIKVDSYDFLPR